MLGLLSVAQRAGGAYPSTIKIGGPLAAVDLVCMRPTGEIVDPRV